MGLQLVICALSPFLCINLVMLMMIFMGNALYSTTSSQTYTIGLFKTSLVSLKISKGTPSKLGVFPFLREWMPITMSSLCTKESNCLAMRGITIFVLHLATINKVSILVGEEGGSLAKMWEMCSWPVSKFSSWNLAWEWFGLRRRGTWHVSCFFFSFVKTFYINSSSLSFHHPL